MPAFVTKISAEVLDLTISMEFVSSKIARWLVFADVSCSDHWYIQFEIKIGIITVTQYRNKSRLDVDGFQRSFETHLRKYITTIKKCDQMEISVEQI